MKKLSLLIGALAIALAVINPAHAVPVTPTYDTFGSLPEATFGGSGIPNHSVAISTSGGVTIGVTAHQRFAGPDLINDGAGTFIAPIGTGLSAGLSKWNFAFFGRLDDNAVLGATWKFYYDLDPAVGNDQSGFGIINLGFLHSTPTEGSQNPGFGFLITGVPGIVIPSDFSPFDPEANGQYSFVVEAQDESGAQIGRAAINVNVGDLPSVPDGGSSLAMLGIAVTGLGYLRRKLV